MCIYAIFHIHRGVATCNPPSIPQEVERSRQLEQQARALEGELAAAQEATAALEEQVGERQGTTDDAVKEAGPGWGLSGFAFFLFLSDGFPHQLLLLKVCPPPSPQ